MADASPSVGATDVTDVTDIGVIYPGDTPIHRATINQMVIEELDALLDSIRVRRLAVVQKLEKVAKVKAEDGHLQTYLKFERTLITARKAIAKLGEDEAKAEVIVNKLRALAMEMEP